MVLKVAFVVVVAACAATVALADDHLVYHPPPHQHLPPPQHLPHHQQLPHPQNHRHPGHSHSPNYLRSADYPDVPPNYEYKYTVADAHSGNNYEANEKRNGDNTEGQYVVHLPDGRTQIFNYADNGDGLLADVKYEGEAKHPVSPQQVPSYISHPPLYHPPLTHG